MVTKILIGYAYVVGDILHEGHLLHLRNCRALCDKLIVGVLTDEAAMEKKPRPSIPFEERIQILAGLRWVDAVVAQETYSPLTNIRTILPDVLFECSRHDIAELEHIKSLLKNMRIISMPYYPKQSSTAIKDKIRGEK